jgi:fatty acid desaturase
MSSAPLSGVPRTGGRGDARGAYTELAQLVRETSLMERRYLFYWLEIVAAILAFGLVWWGVVLVGDSWLQLLLAAGLGLVVTQFGFLGHDGAHQQIFRSPAWNEWSSRLLAGAFAGLSYGWWRTKHNRHHAAPNQEGKDPDIFPGAISFTPAAVDGRRGRFGRWFVKRQGWLFFPLLTLEGLNLHAEGVRAMVRTVAFPHRKLELVLVGSRLTSYVVVLLVLLPPAKAAAFFVVQMATFGLCLGGSFAPSHKGMPIVPPTSKIDFFQRQVLMSRNVRGGWLVDFAMGGLNYQIEHHLFPSMARPNLRRVQPIVRAYCARQGVPYTEVGLFESYGIVVDYLNHVGLQARGPFECPITAQYRT